MKSDINTLVCILFVHLSSIILENFRDRALIIPEILELIKLHTYKFGLVYTCLFLTALFHPKFMINHDDFDFDIVNFPFLDGGIPRRPSNGVYISQLIRFARV